MFCRRVEKWKLRENATAQVQKDLANELLACVGVVRGSYWVNIWVTIETRAGYHQVPHDTTLTQYFAHNNHNITIQQFRDNRHIKRHFIHDTSRYLCHWRNSEFFDCTESISQELRNIVNQFHINDSQVNKEYTALWLFLTNTLTAT